MSAPVIAEGLYSWQIGGSERVAAELALAFRRRGYEVAAFALYDSEGPFKRQLAEAGVNCLDLNYLKRWRWTRRLTSPLAIRRALREAGVTALHLHHANALIHCGWAAAHAGVRRVVMTEHGLHQLQENAGYRRRVRRYLRQADAMTFVAAEQAEYFRDQLGGDPARMHVVPNGVQLRERDAAQRLELRGALGVAADAFVWLYAGRLNEVKNLPLLLAAFAALPEPLRARSELLLAGDGPERALLERRAAELGIGGRLQFLGARSDIPALLNAADAFVMSSRTEGLPMALLEAMGTGVPCVATAVGGVPGLLADGCGLLAPPGDSAALAATMRRLMEDAALRRSLAEAGRVRVAAHYSLEVVVSRYLGLLGLPEHWP